MFPIKKLSYLVFLFAIFGIQQTAKSQELNQKFDSKGHAKAKGVWAQVRYPDGWLAKEGQRPNIVQIFMGKHEGMDLQLQLIIRDAGQNIEKDCAQISEGDMDAALTDKESDTTAKNSRKIKTEGKTGFITEVTTIAQRVDLVMTLAFKQMSVCHKNTMIALMCGGGLLGSNPEQTKDIFDKTGGLCRQYFNSFVLLERY